MNSTPAATATRATLDDLMRVEGKAELIGGRVVRDMGTGFLPNRVAGRIFRSLDDHAEATGHGVATTDNLIYAVPELSSGRESFSPDAAYYSGPLPANTMDVIAGPPTFAVEVRSKSDYGPAAEREQAAKRADYFEAGTLIVWDVDPIARSIRSYSSATPDAPTTFEPSQTADAERAVPGWRLAVDRIFA